MKLNVKAIAIAHSAVAGILFVLCRVVFMLAPPDSLAAMKYLFHTDLSSVGAGEFGRCLLRSASVDGVRRISPRSVVVDLQLARTGIHREFQTGQNNKSEGIVA